MDSLTSLTPSLSSIPRNELGLWYLTNVILPLSAGILIYRTIIVLTKKRRRPALQGKVVIITGASSGIGEALAHLFYENGSKVILAARRESELNRVKQEVLSKKVEGPIFVPVVLPLDLGNLDSIDKFVENTYKLCGKVDIVINNGGISYRGSALHTKFEVFKLIMDVNYFGSVCLTKALLPDMVARKSGQIAFVSSVLGIIAMPERSVYAASKHALQAFCDSLRAEMKQHNINVSMFSPGFVNTNISKNALTASGDKHGVTYADTAAGYTAEATALRILDMVVNKENDVLYCQLIPRVAIFLRHAFPSLFFWTTAKRALPTSL